MFANRITSYDLIQQVFFILMVLQAKTSDALTKLLSLQASEAVLVDKDKDGNVIGERKIVVDLVQRGDTLKVSKGEIVHCIDGKAICYPAKAFSQY